MQKSTQGYESAVKEGPEHNNARPGITHGHTGAFHDTVSVARANKHDLVRTQVHVACGTQRQW